MIIKIEIGRPINNFRNLGLRLQEAITQTLQRSSIEKTNS